MKTLLPLSATLGLALVLSSCDTTSSSSSRHRTARYLPYEVANNKNYGATNSESSPIPDH